jgi:hypothetical protein
MQVGSYDNKSIMGAGGTVRSGLGEFERGVPLSFSIVLTC